MLCTVGCIGLHVIVKLPAAPAICGVGKLTSAVSLLAASATIGANIVMDSVEVALLLLVDEDELDDDPLPPHPDNNIKTLSSTATMRHSHHCFAVCGALKDAPFMFFSPELSILFDRRDLAADKRRHAMSIAHSEGRLGDGLLYSRNSYIWEKYFLKLANPVVGATGVGCVMT